MKFHILCSVLTTCLAAVWGSGCITSKPSYLISVSNQTTETVQDVVIEFNGKTVVSSALIEANQQRSGEQPKQRMPSKYVVRWKTGDGVPHQRQLHIENPLLRDFEGELYFQINETNSVKAFVLPEFNKRSSAMPWGEPAQWEGSPSIPGLTGE